jgi:hypothetical protein
VRVIELESEPTFRGRGRQRYRIYDAATGLIEQGSVAVADMINASPWLDESFDFPVEVDQGSAAAAERPVAVA